MFLTVPVSQIQHEWFCRRHQYWPNYSHWPFIIYLYSYLFIINHQLISFKTLGSAQEQRRFRGVSHWLPIGPSTKSLGSLIFGCQLFPQTTTPVPSYDLLESPCEVSARKFHQTSPFAIRGTMEHALAGKPESRVQVDNPNMYSRLHVE